MHKSIQKKASESIIRFLKLEIKEIIFCSSSNAEYKEKIFRYFSQMLDVFHHDVQVLHNISDHIYRFDIETDSDGCTFLQSIMENYGVIVMTENKITNSNYELPTIEQMVMKNRSERQLTRKKSKQRTAAFREKLNSFGGNPNG